MSEEPFNRSIVVALFEQVSAARNAAAAVRSLGLTDQHVGLLAPGERLTVSEMRDPDVSGLLALAASGTDGNDIGNVLLSMGVPDGEARFYAAEAREGRSLVVVTADGRANEVRQMMLERGGYDVQSRGRDFIRAGDDGVPGGLGAPPEDLTQDWTDVRSRYEMLWQQHYGTSDATWEQMEPLYEYTWRLANQQEYRGRAWSEVASAVKREWSRSGLRQPGSWQDASGPMHDVWDDVVEEAATGAEGGADRRIATFGSDQTIAARDLEPPAESAS